MHKHCWSHLSMNESIWAKLLAIGKFAPKLLAIVEKMKESIRTPPELSTIEENSDTSFE